METITTVHCFEKAGLGKAPFRYIGMVDQNIKYGQATGTINGIEFSTKPGGSCAYCGTYIVNMFNVESADGNRFHVGCECIKKTGDQGLIRLVAADIKKAEKAKRDAKKSAALQRDQELCENFNFALYADTSHPNPYFASEGKTLADWAQWMKANRNWKGLAAFIRANNKK